MRLLGKFYACRQDEESPFDWVMNFTTTRNNCINRDKGICDLDGKQCIIVEYQKVASRKVYTRKGKQNGL